MSCQRVGVDYGLSLSNVQPPMASIFSAETYVGNWYEETVQNTLKRNEFMKKRECEELCIQKSQIMADMLLKPVCLTERRDGYVYFGDSVQILAPGPDCATVVAGHPFKSHCNVGHLALSAAVPPTEVDYNPYLNTDSIISASPHLFPVVRNSFVIERPDCPDDNTTVLHYGDVFRVRAMPTQHWPLYLHSAPAIPMHAATIHSAKQLVRFSDTKNPNTLWKLIPLDPMDKLKIELGIPVPLKTKMLFQHALSGHNLSIEPDFRVLTYFGCEFEVTVHTKWNCLKQTTWANHWVIDTENGWRKPDPVVLAQAKFSAAINANQVNKSASEEEKEKHREEEESDEATDGQTEIQIASQPIQLQPISGGVGHVPRNKRCTDQECFQTPCDSEIQERQQLKPNIATTYEPTPEQCSQLPKEFSNTRLGRSVSGQLLLPYDWRTAPQPHAEEYRLSEIQGFYPNTKWNCGGTQCCYKRDPNPRVTEDTACPPVWANTAQNTEKRK